RIVPISKSSNPRVQNHPSGCRGFSGISQVFRRDVFENIARSPSFNELRNQLRIIERGQDQDWDVRMYVLTLLDHLKAIKTWHNCICNDYVGRVSIDKLCNFATISRSGHHFAAFNGVKEQAKPSKQHIVIIDKNNSYIHLHSFVASGQPKHSPLLYLRAPPPALNLRTVLLAQPVTEAQNQKVR